MKINREIELTENRCYDCGRWWALEANLDGKCPRCARIKGDRRHADLNAANKTIAALRGALTRARNRGTTR